MLKKIFIENINSIGKCEIDFEKGNYTYLPNRVTGDVVNPIAIYGHNGSGKSSFIDAIAHFVFLLNAPLDVLQPFIVNNINFENFRKKSKETSTSDALVTSLIQFEFELEQNKFLYHLEISRVTGIKQEFLRKNDNYVFNRIGLRLSYKGKDTLIDKESSPLLLSLRSLSSKNSDDSDLNCAFTFLNSFVVMKADRVNAGGFIIGNIFSESKSINDLLISQTDKVKEIFKKNEDFPLFTIHKKEGPTNFSVNNQYFIEIEDKDGFKTKLPYSMISSGMRNAVILVTTILSLTQNSVLYVDEIESALHPSAIKLIIDLVSEKQIQLVFSSHNTNLLQYLRPDQIYFAKWEKGFSSLYRLSKLYPNIRQVNNIEKMYLSKLFDLYLNNTNGEK